MVAVGSVLGCVTRSIAFGMMHSRTGRVAWIAGLAAALLIRTTHAQQVTEAGKAQSNAATFAREAVAADHGLASAAGAEILAAGGNAVDGAVATAFALSVVRPFSCGIGGGGFMVIALPARDGKGGRGAVTTAINYRETCPGAVGPEYYQKLGDEAKEAARHGGRAVATPGTIAGLVYALEKYGSMDRARVMAPAIRIAREGFVVDAAYLAAARDVMEQFDKHPEWKTRFVFMWERLLASGKVKEGDRIVLPEQAAALELVAKEGIRAMTEGALGRAVCAAVQADGGGGGGGGALTIEDVRAYKVVEVEPIRFEAFGRTMVTMPPPSSGGVALAQIFGIMERGGGVRMVEEKEWGPLAHVMVESFKHAFADRAEWMADPAFVDVPVARLLSGAYLDERAAKISARTTHGPEWYGSRAEIENDGGTSHLCVVDAHGGAAACTETINLAFGSLLAVPEFGFVLNDQMDDFTTRSGKANAFGLVQSDRNLPAAGKRPLSSMTPTIVLDKEGRVEAVAGASGGPRIITGTAQVIFNGLVLGLSAEESVARARMHHQWKPNVLEIEAGYPGEWRGLEVSVWMRKFHHQTKTASEHCAVQFIKRAREEGKGKWEAASDPRKGGRVAGK